MDLNSLLKPLSYIFILCLGAFLRSSGFFKENDHRLLTMIVLKITLPAAIIRAFSQMSGRDTSLYWVVAIGLACALLPIIAVYLFSRKTSRENRIFGMINVSGFNIGCFALPIIQGFFGAHGAVIACMFDVGNTVMSCSGAYSMTSALLGTTPGEKPSTGSVLKEMFKKFATSIPLIACVVMLALNILSIPTPTVLSAIVDPIASANSFLAMFMVGSMFKLDAKSGYISAALRLVGIRTLFSLIFTAFILFCTPFDPETKRVLAMLTFAPIPAAATAYTEICGGDGALASFTNSVSTITSLVIMISIALLPL